jgi:GTPase SAR1 family protein
MSTNTETTASASTSTSTSTSTAGASASAAASADKSRLKKMEPPVIKRIEEQTEESPAPVCVLIVGMAGSGKTTLMKQLQESTMNDNDDDEEVEKEEEKVEGDNSANKDDDDDDDDDNDDDDNKKSSQNKKKNMPAYCINLDPACLDVPYSPSIDIRDTVDYKQVMSQHHLGPNGAIMTSLNLYATKFDQVINILEQRADENKLSEFLLVDTPGQVRPIFIPN